MGIKCLLKFINEEKIKNENFKNKKIAIDISILIYKIVISIRSSGADYTNQRGEITSHILGLFNKTIELLHNKIIPVYVFDGKPPELKNKTLEDRKNIRKKALEKMILAETEEEKIKLFKKSTSISKEQWDQCRDLLNLMGVPYINAPEEADSQCAYLAKEGFVDAVLTEDMDILTFGSPKIVRNLTSHKTETTEIILENVLKKLELNQEQFIDFCILLGSDYCPGIPNLKPDEILEYFKKNKNIKDTLELMKKDNIKIPTDFNYEETKEYFLNPTVSKVEESDIKIKKPDTEKLIKKLVNEYGFIKNLIKTKLMRLDEYYKNILN